MKNLSSYSLGLVPALALSIGLAGVSVLGQSRADAQGAGDPNAHPIRLLWPSSTRCGGRLPASLVSDRG
jgi:hypothetical protein